MVSTGKPVDGVVNIGLNALTSKKGYGLTKRIPVQVIKVKGLS